MDSSQRLHDKLDKILDEIGEIKVTIAKQQVGLDEHMRRTAINEESLDLLRQEFQPVKQHVLAVNVLAKVGAGLSVLVGVVAGVIKIVEFFR